MRISDWSSDVCSSDLHSRNRRPARPQNRLRCRQLRVRPRRNAGVGEVIFQPRPYQHLITGHQLDMPRGGTWAGMGMGKTGASLESIACRLLSDSRPTLVLAPLRVAQSTWPDEAKKWDNLAHIEVVPNVGSAAERAAAPRRDAPVFSLN